MFIKKKKSSFSLILFLLVLSSIGCKKEVIDGLEDVYVFIPNVMSTTSQDNNKLFPEVFPINIFEPTVEVEYTVEVMDVFDRYGSHIFRAEQFPTNDSTYGWDGTVEGQLVESGIFSYSIRITDGIGSAVIVDEITVL